MGVAERQSLRVEHIRAEKGHERERNLTVMGCVLPEVQYYLFGLFCIADEVVLFSIAYNVDYQGPVP